MAISEKSLEHLTLPPEIIMIIVELAALLLLPSDPANLRPLARLCAVSRHSYLIATRHLYHTVVLPADTAPTSRLNCFLNTMSKNAYLAAKVVNLWIGDTELKLPNGYLATTESVALAIPSMPNLQRFAIDGTNTSVKWDGLCCTHLTVTDLKHFAQPIPVLRTLHLIDSLLSPEALESALRGSPALQTVIFELTEPFGEKLEFGTLMQLAVVAVKTVPRLRKLTFRIENFWILHNTTFMLPAKLAEEGLREKMRGKTIATVWSWELGMDFCGIWIANCHRQRVGKEHRICY
ncbi:hypothetical protein BDV93DRAFT_34711 [Ceratobasidium sp. AG-I]|nr:hypothetical protein BDV93DRAFT_34711 [Ceratobasidium sp. AG-I]